MKIKKRFPKVRRSLHRSFLALFRPDDNNEEDDGFCFAQPLLYVAHNDKNLEMTVANLNPSIQIIISLVDSNRIELQDFVSDFNWQSLNISIKVNEKIHSGLLNLEVFPCRNKNGFYSSEAVVNFCSPFTCIAFLKAYVEHSPSKLKNMSIDDLFHEAIVNESVSNEIDYFDSRIELWSDYLFFPFYDWLQSELYGAQWVCIYNEDDYPTVRLLPEKDNAATSSIPIWLDVTSILPSE